jgi:hypothetical protein
LLTATHNNNLLWSAGCYTVRKYRAGYWRDAKEYMMSTALPPYRPLQDGLRATGHYLDRNGQRLVTLLVVSVGFVITLMPADIRQRDDAVLLTHDDLRRIWIASRVQRSKAGAAPPTVDPFFPTGYEDFLRALGDAAARQKWAAVRLVRIGEEAILRHGMRVGRQEIVLKARDIEAILNRAFQQRGHGPMS